MGTPATRLSHLSHSTAGLRARLKQMSPLSGSVDPKFERLLHGLVPITAMTQTLPWLPLEEGLDANLKVRSTEIHQPQMKRTHYLARLGCCSRLSGVGDLLEFIPSSRTRRSGVSTT